MRLEEQQKIEGRKGNIHLDEILTGKLYAAETPHVLTKDEIFELEHQRTMKQGETDSDQNPLDGAIQPPATSTTSKPGTAPRRVIRKIPRGRKRTSTPLSRKQHK